MIQKLDDLLLQVQGLSQSLLRQTDGILPCSPQFSNANIAIPNFVLDVPSVSEISSVYQATGAPPSIADELATIHVNSCSDLSQRYTSIYKKTCKELRCSVGNATHRLSSLYTRIGRLQEAYIETVEGWAEESLASLRLRFGARMTNRNSTTSKSDDLQPFNHGYVSILESFFKMNQYPSRADRVHLAKKSGMALRQINVWFQNRRTRTRRAAKARSAQRENSIYSDQSGYAEDQSSSRSPTEARNISPSNYPEDEPTDVEDEDEGQVSWSRSTSFTLVGNDDPLECTAPPYAFPTKYPPIYDVDPFPCRTGAATFPKLQWYRKASVPAQTQVGRPAPDVEFLVSGIRKLTIRDDDYGDTLDFPTGTWTSAATLVTKTFPAPLPSFIPSPQPKSQISYPVLQCGAVRSTLPFTRYASKEFSGSFCRRRLENVKSTSTNDKTTPSANAITKARKMAPFPRRRPRGPTTPNQYSLGPWRRSESPPSSTVPSLCYSSSTSESSETCDSEASSDAISHPEYTYVPPFSFDPFVDFPGPFTFTSPAITA